ncbi:MAG: alpha-glucan family phosphorylase [Proteobacteria bacterium]|nr:alpha-glucan family phosphorylase [Pseudomonadota bacterium]
MKHIQPFQVFPVIPEPLSFLDTLSRNLWWSWQNDAKELYKRIDPKLWEKSEQNPIVFLTNTPKERLEELAKDESFLVHQKRIRDNFVIAVLQRLNVPGSPFQQDDVIAYFSMEFGIHECIPLFAGGLGVLAGDHLKAASDLMLPMVGVGLLYKHGYFRQFLSQDGMQQEEYPETDLYKIPVEKALDLSGKSLYVTVNGPNGNIRARVWKVNIGRVPLYLLDTNLPDNPPEIRDITANLYPANQNKRVAQEVLLGIGGMRALAAMGIFPTVVHLNEGHCTFASIERIDQIISKHNVDLKTALEIVPRSTVFTTHTPVIAGHDVFPTDIVKPYLQIYKEKLETSEKEILSWGKPAWKDSEGQFSMFILGLKMAQYCNGVSKLHGSVARKMWSHVWPERPVDEIPITHITNGVHVPSWISHEISLLLDRYLGSGWNKHPWDPALMNRIDGIYDEELWHIHEINRTRLVRKCRELMIKQYEKRNTPKLIMNDVESVLDQDALTIVFARRFATYKRSHLLFMDPERLESILTSKTHPVQIIFAGKAHPKDQEGKDLIKYVIRFAQKPELRHHLIFLEDYDINIARMLVQGADVWLNTPRRPFEACGTSGMKSAINGGLNVGILDGWWCEGYSEGRGWRIGKGEEYFDSEYQDNVESQALYNVLSDEVIPCFYDKKNNNYSQIWLSKMKESMKMAMQYFCSHVMVANYNKKFYISSAKNNRDLLSNNSSKARALSFQRERLQSLWKLISIKPPKRKDQGPFRVDDTIYVSTEVFLGEIIPEEVEVQLYYGRIQSVDSVTDGKAEIMTVEKNLGNGNYIYNCAITCCDTGRFGLTARVMPKGDEWIKSTQEFLTWA